MKKIYVASSWRNLAQRGVIGALRVAGHEVYDFRNPASGKRGFRWSDVERSCEYWTKQEYIKGLEHPAAKGGYKSDMDAMEWADTCVLALPCNRSSHLELGWFVGQGKRTIILLDVLKPELMYKMVDRICITLEEVVEYLRT